MTAEGLDAVASYAAIHQGLVGYLLERDVVRVAGPDALGYLEGQCTQRLEGLEDGAGVEALLLSPQGKIDAAVRVVRLGTEDALVEVEPGYGPLVEERLRRFKIRVKADLELVHWTMARLLGPDASGRSLPEPGSARLGEPLAIGLDWPGLAGVDLLGPGAGLPEGVPIGDPIAFEVVRIEAGMPAMATELAGGLIPQETGLVERTVSFTKGCYTGQELVARLDARGNRVPKRLFGVVVAGPVDDDSIGPGAALTLEGKDVGTLSSVAAHPVNGGLVALAYVRREVVAPAEVELVDTSGTTVSATVRELPLWQG